jgi:hypothetical protein
VGWSGVEEWFWHSHSLYVACNVCVVCVHSGKRRKCGSVSDDKGERRGKGGKGREGWEERGGEGRRGEGKGGEGRGREGKGRE